MFDTPYVYIFKNIAKLNSLRLERYSIVKKTYFYQFNYVANIIKLLLTIRIHKLNVLIHTLNCYFNRLANINKHTNITLKIFY